MKKTNKLILGILISVLSLSAAYLVYLVGFNRGEKNYNKFGLNAGELAAALRADKKYFAFTGNVKDISLPEKTIFLAISANNETTEIKTTEGTKVHIVKDKYLRTDGDQSKDNDLLDLKECK